MAIARRALTVLFSVPPSPSLSCCLACTAARQQKIKKMEHKMVSFMQQANQQLDSSGFELKAVFVTFNTQGQAQACLAACPRRECDTDSSRHHQMLALFSTRA